MIERLNERDQRVICDRCPAHVWFTLRTKYWVLKENIKRMGWVVISNRDNDGHFCPACSHKAGK